MNSCRAYTHITRTLVADVLSATGDPWREATKAASGTHFQSTPDQPLAISDGFHCSDLSTTNANVDSTVKAVQQQALTSIAGWLDEWKPSAH